MRLIDADKLERELNMMIEDYEEDLKSNDEKEDIQNYMKFIKFFKNFVNTTPTEYDVDKVVDETKVLCHCSIEDESFTERLLDVIQKGGVK